ncbi:MAG: YkvA family protein [Pseudanabaenaceae cyanobacterium]
MFLLRNSRYNWLILLASLIYLISPFDVLPDIFPLLGQVDDFLLLAFLITNLVQNLFPVLLQAQSKEKEEEIKTIDVDATTIN